MRQIIHGGLQPTDTVGLPGLPLGMAGLAAAVVALREPAEPGRCGLLTLARS
ncbi:hypothetical protein AB0478_40105 [Streptomyces sp. NPDC051917]|uniref:hypothetical protein n=1 Tax=Streptomyces sp. NPDC051917 TaxID=3154754 RepID=UPI003451486C